jgi:hypothetical protein
VITVAEYGIYIGPSEYVYEIDIGPQAIDGTKVAYVMTVSSMNMNRSYVATLTGAGSATARDWTLYE